MKAGTAHGNASDVLPDGTFVSLLNIHHSYGPVREELVAKMPHATAKKHSVPRDRGAAEARKPSAKDASLLVRVDRRAKHLLQRAATERGLTVSDYVRTRILPLARQDVDEAETGVLKLAKGDQIAFWQALQNPRAPTPAQLALGKLVRSVR